MYQIWFYNSVRQHHQNGITQKIYSFYDTHKEYFEKPDSAEQAQKLIGGNSVIMVRGDDSVWRIHKEA